MKKKKIDISGFKAMWLMAMFDLPVQTSKDRRNYSRFRTYLLKEGFTRLQFSVYARFCNSEERTKVFRKRLEKIIPPAGEVRLIAITDKQFGKMEIYAGKKSKNVEKPPPQLSFF